MKLFWPQKDNTRQTIAAYKQRTGVKIYDAFIFFNELDLLEIRLNILDAVVDYFVIVEATKTFSGQEKPLFFEENRDRFSRFNNKIIHYVTRDTPDSALELRERLQNGNLTPLERDIIETTLTTDNVPQDQPHWLREFYQKESIRKALVGVNDNDFCFISDVDEIWNPGVEIDLGSDKVYKLRQLVYAYYLNNRSSEKWAGTYATKYLRVKRGSINHLDTPSKTKYQYLRNGGWHFTNQGGAEMVRKKIESYGHQEYNNDAIKSDIEKKISSNKDFVGRRFRFWTDASELPQYLIEHRSQYAHMFK